MSIATLHNLTDAALAERCKRGDATGQKLLYNRYADELMLLCLRYVPGYEEAKEVLMDGLCNAFKNIDSFSWMGDGSLHAWLKKIMVNQCLMHLRKRRPLFATDKDITAYEDASAGEDILGTLNVKEIMRLIHALPDGYRTVFNLYAFEGKNHREIAEMLNISENTSKSQLYKARAMLKKQILMMR